MSNRKPMQLGEEDVNYLLSDVSGPHRDELRQSLSDIVASLNNSDDKERTRVLDPNVLSGGGRAFLWNNALALSDAIDTVDSSGAELQALGPEILTKSLVMLVKLWHRLRKIAVKLSRDEFIVIRAVKKRSPASLKAITAYTGLSEGLVKKTVAALKKKKYLDKLPLIEINRNGKYVTRF